MKEKSFGKFDSGSKLTFAVCVRPENMTAFLTNNTPCTKKNKRNLEHYKVDEMCGATFVDLL